MLGYIGNIGIGVDITLNAIFGGKPYQTISCRIGESIIAGGWAAKVNWPPLLKSHFLSSVFETEV